MIWIEHKVVGLNRAADAAAVADATVQALRLLFAELDPLLGVRAVLALYSRSLHLTRSFSWRTPEPAGDPIVLLHQELSLRSLAESREASQALLQTFIGLLVVLIGRALTDRLMTSAWGGATAQKPAQGTSDER